MNSDPAISLGGVIPSDLGIIRRTFVTAGALGLVLGLVFWVHLGWPWAVGFAGGAVVGALNLLFLTALIREIVTLGRKDMGKIVALLAMKIPLVYGGLAALLIWKSMPTVSVVVGFSLVLLVIVLKAAGRALLDTGLFRDSNADRARGGEGSR